MIVKVVLMTTIGVKLQKLVAQLAVLEHMLLVVIVLTVVILVQAVQEWEAQTV